MNRYVLIYQKNYFFDSGVSTFTIPITSEMNKDEVNDYLLELKDSLGRLYEENNCIQQASVQTKFGVFDFTDLFFHKDKIIYFKIIPLEEWFRYTPEQVATDDIW
jgi:hypothetical protein